MQSTMSDNRCTICDELKGKQTRFPDWYGRLVGEGKTVLYSGNGLSVVPSLGPLNSGHLLIVPWQHVMSISSLPVNRMESFQHLKHQIREKNRSLFGCPTEFFEHGSSIDAACGNRPCVAHAHVHAVPVANSLLPVLQSYASFRKSSYDKLFSPKSGFSNGYVTLEDVTGELWLNDTITFLPQFLRLAYCEANDPHLNWNWKVNQRPELVRQIVRSYTGIFAGSETVLPEALNSS